MVTDSARCREWVGPDTGELEKKWLTYLVLIKTMAKIPHVCMSLFNLQTALRDKAVLVLFPRLTHVHMFFSWNALSQACSGFMGLFDAEAKFNGQGSSPDSPEFSKLLSLLAPLILPVWERPRIPQTSRILKRRKGGWEEHAMLTHAVVLPSTGEGGVTLGAAFLMALPDWHAPLPGSGSLTLPGWLLLGCGSGLHARQTLAFNPAEAGARGQVLHVNDWREVETTPALPVYVNTSPTVRVCGGEGRHACSHVEASECLGLGGSFPAQRRWERHTCLWVREYVCGLGVGVHAVCCETGGWVLTCMWAVYKM